MDTVGLVRSWGGVSAERRVLLGPGISSSQEDKAFMGIRKELPRTHFSPSAEKVVTVHKSTAPTMQVELAHLPAR